MKDMVDTVGRIRYLTCGVCVCWGEGGRKSIGKVNGKVQRPLKNDALAFQKRMCYS